MDTGELATRTFRDYYATCDNILSVLGCDLLVDDLLPADFENLRKSLSKKQGPVALGNEIGRCRMHFKYAYEPSRQS